MEHEDQTGIELEPNLLHAVATWLARMGAGEDAIAVITVSPVTAIGLWEPGDQHVRALPKIDDAAAEVCEAVAPIAQKALETLGDDVLEAISMAAMRGARLQVLVDPRLRSIVLRMADDTISVQLCSCEIGVPV